MLLKKAQFVIAFIMLNSCTLKRNHIVECDVIDTDFPKFQNFKCDNITFSDYVRVDEDMEGCEKLTDDGIIKTI